MNRSFVARLFSGLLLACFTLGLASCGQQGPYYYSQYQYGNRTVPPSGILQRVLATYTDGNSGGAEILDGLRDIRSNIQNTIRTYFISGFSDSRPVQIINFPQQQVGYILGQTSGTLAAINYATEASSGAVASFGTYPSVAVGGNLATYVGTNTALGQLDLNTTTGSFALNIPDVNKVVANTGDTVILAMLRNSNSLYRVVQLSTTQNVTQPPGSIDCEPQILPQFCLVPVKGSFDRPTDAYFSLDGSKIYVLNCGPECGGTTAGVTVLNVASLTTTIVPTVNPLDASAPNPISSLGVPNPIPVPGGVTAALSNGTTLYLAGQQQQADGLFAGYLSSIDLSSYRVTNQVAIADGHHSKLLFADDNTLWIAAQQCATGERAARGTNTNCLTRVSLAASTPAASIIPAVTPGGATTVAYPNTDNNLYYYGSVTGLCWVETFHKVYTAYGGQIHAFNTSDGSEINNFNITVQGTVLDVAYMDASNNTTD